MLVYYMPDLRFAYVYFVIYEMRTIIKLWFSFYSMWFWWYYMNIRENDCDDCDKEHI